MSGPYGEGVLPPLSDEDRELLAKHEAAIREILAGRGNLADAAGPITEDSSWADVEWWQGRVYRHRTEAGAERAGEGEDHAGEQA